MSDQQTVLLMDGVNEIELLQTLCDNSKEENECPSALLTVNTDNLPITQLKNKERSDNCLESSVVTSLSCNTTPTKTLEIAETNLYRNLSDSHLPNTDNLLAITVPKTTLLGKEQAKKRLYAFSQAKLNSLSNSPISKKKQTRQTTLSLTENSISNENEGKIDEKLALIKKPSKKYPDYKEKAKIVIQEIEEIKKIETAYLEFLEQENSEAKSGLKVESKDRSYRKKVKYRRSRSRSSDNNNTKYKRSRNDTNKFKKRETKYPSSWSEIHKKGYSLEMLAEIKSKEAKTQECSDFRKQLLFQSPSVPLRSMTIKAVSGKEKEIPSQFIRFTSKNPKVSYSIKEKLSNDCFLRNTILQYVSKSFQNNMKNILNNTPNKNLEPLQNTSTSRKWYPKAVLNDLKSSIECKVLENSLSLSFLQTYLDAEQEREVKNVEESVCSLENNKISNKDFKDSPKTSGKGTETKKIKTTHKEKKHNRKTNNKLKLNDLKHKKSNNKSSGKRKSKPNKISKKLSTKSKKCKEILNDKSCDDSKIQIIKTSDQNKVLTDDINYQTEHEKNLDKEETKIDIKLNTETEINKILDVGNTEINKIKLDDSFIEEDIKQRGSSNTPELQEMIHCVSEKHLQTPDTDEYYSSWEIDDADIKTQSELLNRGSSLDRSWPCVDESFELSDVSLIKSPVQNDIPCFTNKEDDLVKDLSPFTSRCLDERRCSVRSSSRSSVTFPEMPLNIRDPRSILSQHKWEDEKLNISNNCSFSMNSVNENNIYKLFGEDTWEGTDYLMIKEEEMKLEEERRTLNEERRRLDIERRKLEELERKRYYEHISKYDDNHSLDDKHWEYFKPLDNETSRLKHHREYTEKRKYVKEPFLFKTLSEERVQSGRRSQELYDKTDKNFDKPDEHECKKKRQSRWQSRSSHEKELLLSKEKKNTLKNKWESSEDECTFSKTENNKSSKERTVKDVKHKVVKSTIRDKKNSGNINEGSLTDNLDISTNVSIYKHKPEQLETEYEKFMQSLGSEISATEEISENNYKKKKKQKSRLITKRMVGKKYSRRSLLISSDESSSVSRKPSKKRKDKRRVSSSSSSSSSSTSSTDSDSSTDSSSVTSSSELSSSDERHKRVKKHKKKMKIDKTKSNNIQLKKTDIPDLISIQNNRAEQVIKLDGITNMEPDTTSIKSSNINKIKNLNIINISSSEFLLGEIPLPNSEISKPLTEVPLPVPSPKVIVTHSNDTDLIMPKIEPVSPSLPSYTSITSTELNNTWHNVIIKEEPEEITHLDNVSEFTSISPAKLNLVPIKFLASELKKQSLSNSNLKTLENVKDKDVIKSNQSDTSSCNIPIAKCDVESLPLSNSKRYFAESLINSSVKRRLLDDYENDENSPDFTDTLKKGNISSNIYQEVSTSNNSVISEPSASQVLKETSQSPERHLDHELSRKSRSISPQRKVLEYQRSSQRNSRSSDRFRNSKKLTRDYSPKRDKYEDRDSYRSRRRKPDTSPRRYDRRGTKRYRDNSMESESPKRRREYRDFRSISPSDKRFKKSSKPRSRSPYFRDTGRLSPRSFLSKNLNAPRTEHIQETLERIAGMDFKVSPAHSPLHGFKRSVADSTINDDQLVQNNTERIEDFNHETYKDLAYNSFSPKRVPLDERINQVLSTEDQQPKPIITTYADSSQYDSQYLNQYQQYYQQYPNQDSTSNTVKQYSTEKSIKKDSSTVKVVQIGNVLEVVPSEDLTLSEKVASPVPQPIQQNKVTNSTHKIVQVGNMLQIVPSAELSPAPVASIELPPVASPKPISPVPPSTTQSRSTKETIHALVKQENERRAEKERRKQARDAKRKEKQRKQKEREKRKQLQARLKTEALIKQALIKEAEGLGGDDENLESNKINEQAHWPPVPQIIFSSSHKPVEKGILCQTSRNEDCEVKRKSVKFSDGVVPGEGTSPSGGEELTSPPPAPTKLPKKRFVKTKVSKKQLTSKKKKVKVKVIRQQHTEDDDDDEEEDNLPPPPPPPGSPPPHIFPARIKQPVMNNIHPNVIVSLPNLPVQNADTSYPPPPIYRQPPQPVMIHPHHRPPNIHPHILHHQLPPVPHHQPSLAPVPQVRYNPPVIVQSGYRR